MHNRMAPFGMKGLELDNPLDAGSATAADPCDSAAGVPALVRLGPRARKFCLGVAPQERRA